MLLRIATLRTALRTYGLDLLGVAAAVVIGAPSLLYPFGRDQGLYYYVAREWVLRGQVPYADVLDHKTPGIYVLHGLSVLLFGEVQWGIRVLDLVGVIVFGLLIGSLQGRGTAPAPAGARGGAAALLALIFYGFLDFWNTAQSELWYSGLGLAAVWAARRASTLARASLWCGILAGAALVMKPPAAPFVLLAFIVLAHRAWPVARERKTSLLLLVRYVAGALLVPLLTLGYFASQHALAAMQDIVVGANAYYVKHEPGAPPGFDWKDHAGTILLYFAPFTILFPIGAALALWRRERVSDISARPRILLALGLLLAGSLAVIMQGKFYLLHWAACCIPLTVLGCTALEGFTRGLPTVPRVLGTLLVCLGGYVATSWFPHGGAARWQWRTVEAEAAYLRGQLDEASFHQTFQIPSMGFNYAESHRIGSWLRDHSVPGDLVTVRGFQPEIYAVAHRHHQGRFFWTLFITSPYRAYRRSEWLAEDERDLREHRPRYIVATTHTHEGPESVEWLATLGYRPVLVAGVFTIVERSPSSE